MMEKKKTVTKEINFILKLRRKFGYVLFQIEYLKIGNNLQHLQWENN